jgi:hypothetical protein
LFTTAGDRVVVSVSDSADPRLVSLRASLEEHLGVELEVGHANHCMRTPFACLGVLSSGVMLGWLRS